MQRSRISQLIQMRSIGISDTTSVDSPCHPRKSRIVGPAAGRQLSLWQVSRRTRSLLRSILTDANVSLLQDKANVAIFCCGQ
jgi:hypothetical protein